MDVDIVDAINPDIIKANTDYKPIFSFFLTFIADQGGWIAKSIDESACFSSLDQCFTMTREKLMIF